MFEEKSKFISRDDIFGRIKDIKQVRLLDPINLKVKKDKKDKKTVEVPIKEPSNIQISMKNIKNENTLIIKDNEDLKNSKSFRYAGDDILWIGDRHKF